jgi:hypothetical protein
MGIHTTFIVAALLKLGLPSNFINLIKACTYTTSMSVLANGQNP